jgi:hypothetical protein
VFDFFDAGIVAALVGPLALVIVLLRHAQSRLEHCSLGRLDTQTPFRGQSRPPNGLVREPRPTRPFPRSGRVAMPEPEEPVSVEVIGEHP